MVRILRFRSETITQVSETQFTLLGQLPGGKNAIGIRRDGHHYPNKRFDSWRTAALPSIPHVEMPNTPLALSVRYWKGDLRRRDMTGALDAIFNLFESAGLIKDDKLIESLIWTPMGLDRINPRSEIKISVINTV